MTGGAGLRSPSSPSSPSSSLLPSNLAIAAASAGTAAALLYAYNDSLGISNDIRIAKAEVDFTVQSRRHMFFKHTVADIWEETVKRFTTTKPCLEFAAGSDYPPNAPVIFSFTEVNKQANRIANILLAQGVKAGQTVGLLMSNRAEFIWTVLGCTKVGAVISFLNYNLRPQQLAHCILICDACAILYEDSFDSLVNEALQEISSGNTALLSPVTPSNSSSTSSSSSRSTGPPKILRLRYVTSLTSSVSPATSSTVSSSSSSSSSLSNTKKILVHKSSPTSVPELIINVASWMSSMLDFDLPRKVRESVHMLSPWGFVYTSGTTGLPKAAVITNLRFFMGGHLMSGVTTINSNDRIYTVLPLYHSAGGLIGMGSMVSRGATLILSPKFSARRFWDDAYSHKATVIQYIGELCRYLVGAPSHPKEKSHHIRLAIGNGLRPDVWPKFQSRFGIPAVAEFYASTEGNATLINLCTQAKDQGAVGRFGILVRGLGLFKIAKYDENTETLVRNSTTGKCIECGPDEVGELLGYLNFQDKTGLRSFAGYHGNKEATEKKIARNVFKDNDAWFRTGDLLRMSKEGRYYFVDRIGDTFRWRGENVATTEVAEVLSEFPGIAEVNVYGVSVPGYEGRAGMAALVLKDSNEPNQHEHEDNKSNSVSITSSLTTVPVGICPSHFDIQAFGKFARSNLPSYAVPVFIRILPQVPVTSTFKHVKKDLRDEGADPTKIKDDLFVAILPSATKGNGKNGENTDDNNNNIKYEKITLTRWHDIVSGKARL